MPNHKSAIKRVRQNKTRKTQNMSVRSDMRTAVKKLREIVAKGDKDAATTALNEASKKLSSASSKGVVHKNNASRKISRLATLVNKLG